LTEKQLVWSFDRGNWFAERDKPECYWHILMTEKGRFAVVFPIGIERHIPRPTLLSSATVFDSLHVAKDYCQENENKAQVIETEKLNRLKQDKQNWLSWLQEYGAEKFLDSFLSNVEGAESTCKHCGETIYLDLLVGGGCPDWSTEDGDYGCSDSPDTDEDGTGGHAPQRLVWEKHKWVSE
jgi:hypothetical protein